METEQEKMWRHLKRVPFTTAMRLSFNAILQCEDVETVLEQAGWTKAEYDKQFEEEYGKLSKE